MTPRNVCHLTKNSPLERSRGLLLIAACWWLPCVTTAQDATAADRIWLDAKGRQMSARLLGVERSVAIFLLGGGKRAAVPVSSLCDPDRQAIETWEKGRSPQAALPPADWPTQCSVNQPKVSGPEQTADGYAFRTTHYQFISDSPLAISALQELATAAEATWKWGRGWPLRLTMEADRVLLARILSRAEDLTKAGAPPDTAGFFVPSPTGGTLFVWKDSLGLEEKDGQLRKAGSYHPRVLIHEIGHQLMADRYYFLPFWQREGLAEFMALPTYRHGAFQLGREALLLQLKQRLEDYALRDPATGRPQKERVPIDAWTVPLAKLFTIEQQGRNFLDADLATKHRLYLTSLLATFYFLQFEGDGQARRMRVFLNSVDDVVEYWRSQGNAGRLPDGAGRSFDDIRSRLMEQFLNGESAEEIQSAMVKRYQALGLRVAFGPAGK